MRSTVGILVLALVGCTGSAGFPSPDAAPDVAASAGSCPGGPSPIALDTGSGVLSGTLELPFTCPPYPVALIHVGSGPTDRDGNSRGLRNDALKLLAEALAAGGIASVRYDKRGIAASAAAGPASERELRFSHYVEDAGRWLEMLATDQRFSRRVLIGHSEGSLIGMLAIEGRPGVGFVSMAGPGRPAGTVLREQLAKQLTGTLLTRANEIIGELEAGREVASVPPSLASLFRPSVQPYLIDWFRHDPAAVVKRSEIPPLIVQGTTDLQVSVADAQLLHDARPDGQLAIVDGMNHVLKQASGDLQAQRPSYGDPSLPLHPGLVPPIAAFIGRP